MKRIHLFSSLVLMVFSLSLLSGCDEGGSGGGEDPCEGITCSDRGTCATDDIGEAACECEPGYYAQGLSCLPLGGPPQFTSTPGTQALEGSLYSYAITCVSAPGESLVLSLDSSESCGGVLVDNGDGTGTYSFTPLYEDVGESCTVAFTCTDSAGLEAGQSGQVHVDGLENSDIITNLPAQNITKWGHAGGFQVETNVQVLSPEEQLWSVAGTDCSFDVTVSASGLLTWSCGDVESCDLHVRVTGTSAEPLRDTQTLSISCANSAPEIVSTALRSTTEGMHYTYPVSCIDADGDVLTLAVDSATDTCGGTITDGTYSFIARDPMGGSTCVVGIRCSDSQDEDTQSSTIEVFDFSGPIPLRIVAANLTSGNMQDYGPGHGMRILQALRPDIVLVQELNYLSNSETDYETFASAILGSDFFAVDDPYFDLPNGVISKWPIIESGYWDDPSLSNRELMWAVVDLPGSVDLFIVSVHLHTSPASDQVAAAQIIAGEIAAHKLAHPGEFYYVVGGDFNGPAAVSAEGFGLDDAFLVTEPFPVDDNGNQYTNASRSSHYDFLLTDAAMSTLQVPVEIPSNLGMSPRSYPTGLVFDTRTFTQAQLDEYFPPALTSDSGATGMQHMAVVKAYLIQ